MLANGYLQTITRSLLKKRVASDRRSDLTGARNRMRQDSAGTNYSYRLERSECGKA